MTTRLDDGFSTTISFSENPSVKLWEKEVTPPGIDGGGAIDTTTMRNTEWRTMWPKALKTLTEATVSAAYDPAVYDELLAMIQVNQLITITFSDGSSLAFWGFLNGVNPQSVKEGDQPVASVSIIPTNQNASKVETAPVYSAS